MHGAQLSATRQWARSIEGDYLLLSEVAEILGITERALKDITRRHPELAPGAVGRRGAKLHYLYTPDEVTVLREQMPAHVGSRRVWTPAEYEDRCRRERAVSYWRARARVLTERGDEKGAAIAAHRDADLAAGLRAQRAQRMAERAR